LNPALLQHLASVGSFDVKLAADVIGGGPRAFDDEYWQSRSPVNFLQKVVENNIPAYMVGGEFDLFQRGEPLDYSGLQNAWAGRSVTAPMLPNQQVTGRYQLLDGPWTHLAGSSLDIAPLELEWFDTWLKDKPTGMDRTPTPLHYYDLGTEAFTEHAQYPFPNATPTRYFLNRANRGSLTLTPPSAASSSSLLWSPVGNPCNPTTDQWSAGAISTVTGFFTTQAPCVNTDPLGELTLNKLNFTTTPFTSPTTLAGPITASIYLSANKSETQLVAQIQDVAPNGTITPLTEGALLGSLRALDPATTRRTASG
jgi:putative CocE/NonD family hydrolase